MGLDKLSDLFAEYENQEMSKEEFVDFSGKIVGITGDPRTRAREKNPAKNSINPALDKYGYVLQSSGQPPKYTLVKKAGE